MAEKCYACGSPTTSREHVPPKCLFPTELGVNLRKNLLTVPSCDKHNIQKSDDDEFLLASLAGIIGCNDVGMAHKFTKVDRAIRRSGGRILKKALKEQRVDMFATKNGTQINITWGTPDLKRLNACFALIGKGLFYSQYGHMFEGAVYSEIVYIPLNDRGRMGYRSFVVDQMTQELSKTSMKGENSEVFQWRVGPQDVSGACCAQLIFYGNLSVFLGFVPKGAPKIVNLYDLAQGAKKPVHIRKDGRTYRIN